ncbi:hypothetical protein D9619_004340 [Psilocybe cf. subviscida]|uniref:Uncharacterized protein n=1 Tax=Psilocybe cf. subviscida TaxID=2480587 RepID=A0A8H5BQ82_9AGAR|nr:hypothetical protein D9619_004340 [Psilocybe cf. subviscida]
MSKPPPGLCDPLFDPSLSPDEVLKVFPLWVSTYYAHGEDLNKPQAKALDCPPPTILSMDPSDMQRCLEINPVHSGGSDERLLSLGVKLGLFARLREEAICLDKEGPYTDKSWGDVEIKYVWCDQSTWEIPWGAVRLQADLEDSKKSGRVTRKIDMLRLRGGNYFCHWDKPELALTGLLSGL